MVSNFTKIKIDFLSYFKENFFSIILSIILAQLSCYLTYFKRLETKFKNVLKMVPFFISMKNKESRSKILLI